MRKAALLTAGVLILGTAAVLIFVYRSRTDSQSPQPTPNRVSEHGAQIDRAHATQIAMYKAPEGKTPCETAYNAFTAEVEAARSLGKESIFSFVADRDAFMAGCQELAPEAQSCLAPRYAARNRDTCDAVRPEAAQLARLFVIRGEPQETSDEEREQEPPLPAPEQ